MKAISVVLSHMTYLAVGIVALSLIVASVYIWGDKIEERYLQGQLDLTVSLVRDKVFEINHISETSNLVPVIGENHTIIEIETEIPDKISNKKYTIEFNSNKIIASSTTSKNIEVESMILVPFDIVDSSVLTPFTIKLVRDSTGDKIYLVD